jgi:hypothetical protein
VHIKEDEQLLSPTDLLTGSNNNNNNNNNNNVSILEGCVLENSLQLETTPRHAVFGPDPPTNPSS